MANPDVRIYVYVCSQQEIFSIEEREFSLLQSTLEESWQCDVSGELAKYVAFLRAIK